MRESAQQSIDAFIDAQPVSAFQRWIIFFCFLVASLDGFDAACIGFVGPAIRAHWQLSAVALSPVFGAGLFGTMAGGVLLGPSADRLGRKTVLVFSVLLFGLASLASAFSPDIHFLTVMRFITGIGLGGAMPNAITLTSEYSPAKKRSSYVTLMFCGFTIGASAGGVLTAAIVDTTGWRGVFVAGGTLPLALVPLLLACLHCVAGCRAGRPRALAARGRNDAELAPECAFRGRHVDRNDAHLDDILQQPAHYLFADQLDACPAFECGHTAKSGSVDIDDASGWCRIGQYLAGPANG
jgi:MFS family permease